MEKPKKTHFLTWFCVALAASWAASDIKTSNWLCLTPNTTKQPSSLPTDHSRQPRWLYVSSGTEKRPEQ